MKRKLIFTFIITGFVLILTNSCKKDNTNNQTPPANIVKDIDGNIYHTVTIGTQCWMVENLKTTRYRNGDPIPNETNNAVWVTLKTGAYCDYENADSNSTTYGRIYNYFAVVDNRKLCPEGWHVPSDSDWKKLTNYLGGDSIAGDKLKEAGYVHWGYFNTATNDAGFTALPGGYRSNTGYFYYLGSESCWWSSTEDYTNYGWIRVIFYNRRDIYRGTIQKYTGLSVRCIKDE